MITLILIIALKQYCFRAFCILVIPNRLNLEYKKYFETKRLLLKPAVIEYAEFYLKLLNAPKWLQNIGDRNVKTIKDASVYITEKMTPQLAQLGFSNYTVIRKSDNIKLGSVVYMIEKVLKG